MARVTAAVAALLILAFTAPAQASVKIGQTSSTGSSCQGGVPYTEVQSAAANNDYTVPSGGGVITSWSHDAMAGPNQTIKLKVFRATMNATQFLVVGQSSPQLMDAAGGLQTFKTRITVQAGDVIGTVKVAPQSTIRCLFTTQSSSDAANDNPNADTAVGQIESFGAAGTKTRLNISAMVEPDADGDGWGDETQDNCPGLNTQDQTDTDGDGQGNACDSDDDNDGISDTQESAIGTDPLKADTDGDGTNDGADNCPLAANADQADADGDKIGDVCDPDPFPPVTTPVIQEPPATPPADTVAPTVGLVLKKQKVGRSLTVGFTSTEPGSVTGEVFSDRALKKRIGRAVASVTAAGPGKLVIRLSAKGRKALAKLKKPVVFVRLTVIDAAGNRAVKKTKLALR